VEKYGQATDENIIWLMCIACWLNKAADTHSEYVILFAPLCYVIYTLLALLGIRTILFGGRCYAWKMPCVYAIDTG
jgi:hypothetical protein